MHSPLIVMSKIKNYSIDFISNIDEIIELVSDSKNITFIDSNVLRLYPIFDLENIISVECVEGEKSLAGVANIYSILVQRKANTSTRLVVIGGGILQDLVGFCSSTYCRGIEYILVPTTLLSQVDSCVGGKTSINFKNKKNIIGTFYPPNRIIVYPKFTETLPNIDLISGFGEIYKFHILQDNILEFNTESPLDMMIYNGLRFKIDILSRDEFDLGERKLLNFGHTFGHALETISSNEIPHGIAVILGCLFAVQVSKEFGYVVNNFEMVLEKGFALIDKCGIKFKEEWFDFKNLLEITKSDKKSTGKLTMVLINKNPLLQNIEEYDILQRTMRRIYETI